MDFNPVENSPLFKTVGVIDGTKTTAMSLLQTNQANSEREDLSSLKVWEMQRQEIEKVEIVEMHYRKLQLQRDLEISK
jgi:hypothetical protein